MEMDAKLLGLSISGTSFYITFLALFFYAAHPLQAFEQSDFPPNNVQYEQNQEESIAFKPTIEDARRELARRQTLQKNIKRDRNSKHEIMR
jgi:hypothetical protein